MIDRVGRQQLLCLLRVYCLVVLATLSIFFVQNPISGDIEGEKYQRFYYHVLPVFLSSKYLDHPYDYTADQSAQIIVWSKDIKDSLDQTIERSIAELKSANRSDIDYFWMVDDRGFADFTFIAFHLFGERMFSLSILWLIVFALGVIFTLIVGWNSAGWLILNSLYVTHLMLMPGIFEETTHIGQFVVPNQHLTDTRLFAIVAIPYLFTLLAILFKNLLNLQSILLGTMSIFMLWWLNSIRSSIRIYLIFIVFSAMIVFGWKSVSSHRSKTSSKQELLPSLFLVFAGFAIMGIANFTKATIENDRYGEFGQRTTWHNYLMGYSYSESLSQDLKMTTSDHASLSLVIAFKESGNLESAKALLLTDRERLYNESQVALNWEPGTYDWVESESIARTVAIELLRENPVASLRLFLLEKPTAYYQYLKLEIADSSNIGSYSIKTIFQTFSVLAFLSGILLHRVGSQKSVLKFLAACVLLFLLSSLQTILFYITYSSFGETLIFIGMIFACTSFLVGLSVGSCLYGFLKNLNLFKVIR